MHLSNANEFKSFVLWLNCQPHQTVYEKMVLTYLQILDEFVNKSLIDENRQIKARQNAQFLIDEVKRLRIERINTMWYVRQGR